MVNILISAFMALRGIQSADAPAVLSGVALLAAYGISLALLSSSAAVLNFARQREVA